MYKIIENVLLEKYKNEGYIHLAMQNLVLHVIGICLRCGNEQKFWSHNGLCPLVAPLKSKPKPTLYTLAFNLLLLFVYSKAYTHSHGIYYRYGIEQINIVQIAMLKERVV